MVRDEAGALRSASWTEAFAVAARGLHAAGAVAVLTGGRLTAEDAFAYSTFARVSLGTNDIDFRARPHTAEEADFLAAHVVLTGPGGGGVTYADLEAAKTVVLVGFEPEDEAGAIFLRLRKASRGGTRVLAIAPFSTRGLRKMCGTLVPTAPGDEPAALEALVGHADYGSTRPRSSWSVNAWPRCPARSRPPPHSHRSPAPGWPGCHAEPATGARSRPAAFRTFSPAAVRWPTPRPGSTWPLHGAPTPSRRPRPRR